MTEDVWTPATVARVMRAVLIGHIASLALCVVLAMIGMPS